MSLVELRNEIARLPVSDRDELAAYLMALKLGDQGFLSGGENPLDQPKDRWIPWGDAKTRLGLTEDDLRG